MVNNNKGGTELKALITGATGFVGSHLVDYLLDEVGIEVYGIIRPRSREEFVRADVTYLEADVLDYIGMASVIKRVKPNFVFHLAAQSFVLLSWQAPQATLTTNIIGTLNVLEAVKNECPEAVIQIAGSSEEYGLVTPNETPVKESGPLRPMSPYGVSKVAQDLLGRQYFKSYRVKVVVTRAFNHTGPRRGEVFATSSFAKQIAKIEKGKEPVIYVGNLEAKRDWLDVRDVVKAYWLAVIKGKPGEVYNICSGKAWAVKRMLEILLSYSSIGVRVEQDKSRMRPSDVPILLGDCSKFREKTGWQSEIPFETTLLDLLNYWRERV